MTIPQIEVEKDVKDYDPYEDSRKQCEDEDRERTR